MTTHDLSRQKSIEYGGIGGIAKDALVDLIG
jgi:hypothetical protein